jgi:hypothetical protein
MSAKLIDRDISPVVIRFMLNVYTNQVSLVRWNVVFSSHFPTHNGIRQGVNSSPILFCLYIDELLVKLMMRIYGNGDQVIISSLNSFFR